MNKFINNNIKIRKGNYTYTIGPTYETKTEIQEIIKEGGDAVGMSTFPEYLMCKKLKIEPIIIACLTNYGAGLMKKEKVLILGNKQYYNFKLDDIIDSFDKVYRFNMAWPGKNNGTKFGNLAMCSHIYLNLVEEPVSKDEIMRIYGDEMEKQFLYDWYDFFQS